MKRIILTIATALTVLSATAQTDFSDPHNVSGGVIAPHSALLPYATRDEALAGATAKSTYVQPLEQWTETPFPDGVKFTTRFKYTVKLADREILLRVEGSTGAYEVSVGDRTIGYSTLGSVRTEFDLTKALVENNNIITITMTDAYAASAIASPRDGKLGFRSAAIVMPPKVSVSDIVAETTWNGTNGLLNLGVVMQSYLLNSKNYKIAYELLSPAGEKVAEGEKELSTRMLSRDTVRFFARIPDARAWSAESPELYTLVVRTEHERRTKEFISRKIGFRTVATDDEGRLIINGKAVAANAVEVDSADRLEELKAEGRNMVYVKNSPMSDEFYSLCDRLGLYVCDQADVTSPETDAATTPSNNPEWTTTYILRNEAMYHSSKAHPSVVAFSIARNAQNGIALYETYLHMKSLERSRPILYPQADGQWNSDRLR